MLVLQRGQLVKFKFIFTSRGLPYDPTSVASPSDLYITILRGADGSGPVIDGPYSYWSQNSTPNTDAYIEKSNTYEFTFNYRIPSTLFNGTYTVLARTSDSASQLVVTSNFEVKGDPITLSPVIVNSEKSTVINYQPRYAQLSAGNTSTILLIGHANNIELNVPVEIKTVQQAVDLLGADLKSPLLRGVFDAYAAGARDIMICATAPMLEYVEKFYEKNIPTTIFDLENATPSSYTFYQKYYERLEETYSIIKDLDFVDIIVPLETSILKTNGVDFITQLADYCADFHNTTGYVQMGIIGSRSGGVNSVDIDFLEADEIIVDKLTEYNLDNTVLSDNGRFVIPVYGEGVFQHSQLNSSYISNMAAAYAGLLASNPLNRSLIRARVPGLMSLYGSDLSQQDFRRLENIGINTIYRGKKTKRSIPFEVYLTNDYTMAKSNSTLQKAAQMRLVGYVVNMAKDYAYESIGKFGHDVFMDKLSKLLRSMKSDNIILDFSLNRQVAVNDPGKIFVYIELLSALGLKKIDFRIAAGPGA